MVTCSRAQVLFSDWLCGRIDLGILRLPATANWSEPLNACLFDEWPENQGEAKQALSCTRLMDASKRLGHYI
jgi:hypothetical protein